MEQEEVMPSISSGSFVQWSADNVDHNCRTLDGKGTFHGMGIIASVTPSIPSASTVVGRGSYGKKISDISSKRSIPISEYVGKATFPESLTLQPYSLLQEKTITNSRKRRSLDIVWILN